MNRRVISLALAVAILFTIHLNAMAAQTRSSEYIQSATASLSTGSAAGQISLTYTVKSAVGNASRIGVSTIRVYRASGEIYKTIYGSTTSGLTKFNAISNSGTYTIDCVAGTSYYCVVTFIVQDANGRDTCAKTTNTQTAHS